MKQHLGTQEKATAQDLVMPPTDPLPAVLMDSRQRWRDMAMLSADLAFETDAMGRFTFIAPDIAFGWPSSTLLGQPAELLMAGPDIASQFNPFRPTTTIRQRRAWLRRPDGTSVCFSFGAKPLLDAAGQIVGTRGVGRDVSLQDGYDATVATALRRGQILEYILWRMQQEVLAPRMMQAALDSVVTAIGLEGAAVIDLLGDGVLPSVLHQVGEGLPSVMHEALSLLERAPIECTPAQSVTSDSHIVLVCPCRTRFGEHAGLALWRPIGGRELDADDVTLATSATGLIRVILEHDSIQREMARQARTDPLTGLLNRRAFLDEVSRRIDRLEHEGMPGTLMFIDLDHFKSLNDENGHDVGDEALCLTAVLLRSTVRPQDLVARLGGDEFALWLDHTDEFSAAERAEELRFNTPANLGHLSGASVTPLSMSIGIATRWPGRGEDLDSLMQRADQVMYEVKRAGRGHWRVSRSEDV